MRATTDSWTDFVPLRIAIFGAVAAYWLSVLFGGEWLLVLAGVFLVAACVIFFLLMRQRWRASRRERLRTRSVSTH